jgi:hypothetical protein
MDGLAMLKPTIVPARWTFFMAIIVLLSACSDVDNTASDISTRWYTTEQLAQGKVLFSDIVQHAMVLTVKALPTGKT